MTPDYSPTCVIIVLVLHHIGLTFQLEFIHHRATPLVSIITACLLRFSLPHWADGLVTIREEVLRICEKKFANITLISATTTHLQMDFSTFSYLILDNLEIRSLLANFWFLVKVGCCQNRDWIFSFRRESVVCYWTMCSSQ